MQFYFSVSDFGFQYELELLPDILRGMLERIPTLYPVFQVIPFQHLFQLLKEDTVDVILSFREKAQKKSRGTYKELTRVNAVAILPRSLPLARRDSLTADDLEKEKLVLLNPQIAPDCFNIIQQKIMERRSMSELYLRDSPEGCVALAKAGFGITVLPNLTIVKDPALAYIPLTGFEPMSYGAYYNSTSGNVTLKLFLRLCKEHFSV